MTMTGQERNVSDGNPDGNTFGQSTADKISFYGVTPIIQRANSNQAIADTTTPVSSSPFGFGSTQAAGIITLVNEMRAALIAIGIIKGSA
jgi:hypothetical protein